MMMTRVQKRTVWGISGIALLIAVALGLTMAFRIWSEGTFTAQMELITLVALAVIGVVSCLISAFACFHFGKKIEELERREHHNSIKGDIITNSSHEIRSIMNGVVGITHALEMTHVGDDQREYVRLLRYTSDHAILLLNNILDFSKNESGKLKLEHISFNLHAIVKQTVLMHSLDAKDKGIGLNYYYESGIGKYFLGDPGRIQQMIHNVVGNAIKFTHQGAVSVEVEDYSDISEPQGNILINIRDTGIGISRKKIDGIFDRFTQAEDSIYSQYGGTGLGLSIVKMLVNLMNGSILMRSIEGKGTVVSIRLPLAKDLSENTSIATVHDSGCLVSRSGHADAVKNGTSKDGQCATECKAALAVVNEPSNEKIIRSPEVNMGTLAEMHLETLLLSLLKGCPWGDERKTCPLRETRKLSPEERKKVIHEMPLSEKVRICEEHQRCISRR